MKEALWLGGCGAGGKSKVVVAQATSLPELQVAPSSFFESRRNFRSALFARCLCRASGICSLASFFIWCLASGCLSSLLNIATGSRQVERFVPYQTIFLLLENWPSPRSLLLLSVSFHSTFTLARFTPAISLHNGFHKVQDKRPRPVGLPQEIQTTPHSFSFNLPSQIL